MTLVYYLLLLPSNLNVTMDIWSTISLLSQLVIFYQFIDSICSFIFSIIRENSILIEEALKGKFVIQDFETFSNTINDIYHQCSHFKDGQVRALSDYH